MEYKRNIRE